MPKLLTLGFTLLLAVPALSQTNNTPPQAPVVARVGLAASSAPTDSYSPDTSDDRMLTPPPVSGQAYPVLLGSEERSNYFRGGLAFTSAYSDNVLGAINGNPVSDISYSVAPLVALDETTTRLHTTITYAPGFTFYQRTSARNEADQNAAIDFQYRLSPHVTFSARDAFQKTSNVFNQPTDLVSGAVSGGTQTPNFSVIAPVADRLSNFGNAGISYQFALNDMLGASGAFSNLHYPNLAQVPGLYDASSQEGLAFYSHRVARGHYIGVMYQYQRLMSYPTFGPGKTQTHASLFFYTVSPNHYFSISFFGGPQYADTVQPQTSAQSQSAELRAWNPAGGASVSWQGRATSFALSYMHGIASGAGLLGAVKLDSATVALRQQITRTLNASLGGGYAQNDVIGSQLLGLINGHTVWGTAALQQQVGQHLNVQLGYTRLRQDYSSVAVLSLTPNTNREFVSVSYQFSRPLGR